MTEPALGSRELHPSVVEAASWRLGSELVRRHPHHLVLLRTHPGDGQHDCLTPTSGTVGKLGTLPSQ